MRAFFRKLFAKKTKVRQDAATTAPLTEQQLQAIATSQGHHYELPQLVVGCGQSVGKQRDLNEDSLLAFTTTIAGNSGTVPIGLFLVADGMGGHQYGEVASNAAVRSVAGTVLRKLHPYLFQIPSETMEDSLQEIMQTAVAEAQRTIQRDAPGSGTTLTAALVMGQQVTLTHVGDSRAYFLYPGGRNEVITRDHSLVQRLQELGHISTDEAAAYPHRNVLYRALGQGDVMEPDITSISFPTGAVLMLCSDGLWGVVSEQDLQRAVTDAPNLQWAAQNLVSAANAAGGPDNITVILVQSLG